MIVINLWALASVSIKKQDLPCLIALSEYQSLLIPHIRLWNIVSIWWRLLIRLSMNFHIPLQREKTGWRICEKLWDDRTRLIKPSDNLNWNWQKWHRQSSIATTIKLFIIMLRVLCGWKTSKHVKLFFFWVTAINVSEIIFD